jgi:CRISPR system Cascade subunit CasD
MRTVLLRLEGPFQSWGVQSRFGDRDTGTEPSKSGVLGLVAAALGMARDDDAQLAQLAACRMGVRVDQEGAWTRDEHTVGGGPLECRVHGTKDPVMTRRAYLADGSFLVALGYQDRDLAARVDAALAAPAWILFLGRRACPPSLPVRAGLVDGEAEAALRQAPWPASSRPRGPVRLVLECAAGEAERRVPDQPLSFRLDERHFARRGVRTAWVDPRDLLLEHGPALSIVAQRRPRRPSFAAPPAPLERPAEDRVRDGRVPTARRAPRHAATATAPTAKAQLGISEPLYLARCLLSPQSSLVRAERDDPSAIHRTVMRAFPAAAPVAAETRKHHGVLFRMEKHGEGLVLLVQSTTFPDFHRLPAGYLIDLPEVRRIDGELQEVIAVGARLRFVVRASTMEGHEHRPITSTEGRLAWLGTRAKGAGFWVETVDEEPLPRLRPSKGMTFPGATFRGVLRVIDAEAALSTVRLGLGRARAFGFGLLSLEALR